MCVVLYATRPVTPVAQVLYSALLYPASSKVSFRGPWHSSSTFEFTFGLRRLSHDHQRAMNDTNNLPPMKLNPSKSKLLLFSNPAYYLPTHLNPDQLQVLTTIFHQVYTSSPYSWDSQHFTFLSHSLLTSHLQSHPNSTNHNHTSILYPI